MSEIFDGTGTQGEKPVDDRRPSRPTHIVEDLGAAGASKELIELLRARWGDCDHTPFCRGEIFKLTDGAAQRVIEAIPEGSFSGSPRVVGGFLWFCESASQGDVPVLREAVRSFCAACYENGPTGDSWKELVADEARKTVGAPQGKLRFTVSAESAAVPELRVELVGLLGQEGSLTIRAEAGFMEKLDPLVSAKSVTILSGLLADRALGHIAGPLCAIPAGAHENVLTSDLTAWSSFFDKMSALIRQ